MLAAHRGSFAFGHEGIGIGTPALTQASNALLVRLATSGTALFCTPMPQAPGSPPIVCSTAQSPSALQARWASRNFANAAAAPQVPKYETFRFGGGGSGAGADATTDGVSAIVLAAARDDSLVEAVVEAVVEVVGVGAFASVVGGAGEGGGGSHARTLVATIGKTATSTQSPRNT